ncbi:hypothetical protein G6F70_002739 [Rhizopus microsporus]|uniref:MICOS complex subunit MIC12 n=2 Tax=Rhizopus TaxID=4842 RepID=A0A367KG69_RHIAZ|nr:hypothetical protein G6F71_003891 [Rhizopus microsporus]RCI00842.1 hypothetical protein CU097_001996 [Rhizopus azygosporus]KAG1201920.1 hypothetical protein G6F70_002739 [Rhizopus microsporus]KAG1207540.1 hypothetical protein G6F69_007967 [Rhizopus microsporus]KAG1228337.1 hypothetical protein G6F67_007887 [Rhizopus microsporus]
MPKALSLLAGFGLVTALTYQSRINLITNTAHVQEQIDEAKIKADLAIDSRAIRLSLARPPTMLEKSVDNTILYYERRLIPSVKECWNAQVAKAASAIIQSDLPRKTGKFILRNVFGHE